MDTHDIDGWLYTDRTLSFWGWDAARDGTIRLRADGFHYKELVPGVWAVVGASTNVQGARFFSCRVKLVEGVSPVDVFMEATAENIRYGYHSRVAAMCVVEMLQCVGGRNGPEPVAERAGGRLRGRVPTRPIG